jgi:hypothetical protein
MEPATMQSHTMPPRARISTVLTSFAAVTILVALTATSLAAQQLQADYPLLTDLNDATTTYGAAILAGNPTPPAAPANGVCVNGIYHLSTNGQDVRTPDISSLDANDFQLEIDFKLAALPTSMAPVIMGGNGWRWIGIYVQSTGAVGVKYNNSNHLWSTTILSIDRWYVGVIKFEAGTVELYIDGFMVLTAPIGPLTTGPAGQKNFTTNDYSNGRAHNGCIRNLRLWNDTCLTCGMFTRFSTACGGLTIAEGGSPKPGGTVSFTNGGANANGSAFLFGASAILAPLCPQAPCVLGLNSIGLIPGPTQSIPIPNNTALIGAYAYFQGITVAPSGGCYLLTLSDTLRVRIGQ